MNASLDLRPSPIAGRWYPGEPHRLAYSIDEYIGQAKLPDIKGRVIAVVAPHAGHLYSGPVAGYAFATLKDLEIEVAAVVSPMHYPYPDPLLTSGHAAYQTPLGPILIDRATVEQLSERLEDELGFGLTPVREDPEHSLEIELPFLQRALAGSFQLVPVMVRDQSARVAQALGKSLAAVLKGRPALLVASTDLSHFFPQQQADRLDAEMLHQVAAFDPAGVIRVEEEGKGFACGRSALAAVLWAARDLGGDTSTILHHATSGDVTGDYREVVGYAAAVITRQETPERDAFIG